MATHICWRCCTASARSTASSGNSMVRNCRALSTVSDRWSIAKLVLLSRTRRRVCNEIERNSKTSSEYVIKCGFNFYFQISGNDFECESFALMSSMVRRFALQRSTNMHWHELYSSHAHNKYAWHRLRIRKCSNRSCNWRARFKWKSINTNEKDGRSDSSRRRLLDFSSQFLPSFSTYLGSALLLIEFACNVSFVEKRKTFHFFD